MAENELPIDVGDETSEESQTPLEEKYREQMRQIVSQKIELPISTLPGMIKEQIDLNPSFQRRDRWKDDKRSRFIESIIMNVPIPPVFLGENEYGNYVVLDGRQRLTAIHEFLRNTYTLQKLVVWSELNGSNFHDLEKRNLERTITRRFVPAIVILKESSPQVKYDVFDRLNTGGVIAEPMEIRNAIYGGEFNRLLHKLSREATFKRLWDLPLDQAQLEANPLYSKMGDLELVLRFFALLHYDRMNLRFKDYLGDFMDQRNHEYKRNPAELEQQDTELFNRAITNAWTIFGNDAFRKPSNGQLTKKSAPLADAVMVALSSIQPDLITESVGFEMRTRINELCGLDTEFQKAIGSGTNGKGAIKYRIEAVKRVVAEATSRVPTN